MGRPRLGLSFEPGTREALASMSPSVKRRLKEALRIIADDPQSPRLNLKVMDYDGPHRMIRCRVRDHRIVYEARADVVYVRRIFHRRDGYGWMERL